jgi:hypothetical protein
MYLPRKCLPTVFKHKDLHSEFTLARTQNPHKSHWRAEFPDFPTIFDILDSFSRETSQVPSTQVQVPEFLFTKTRIGLSVFLKSFPLTRTPSYIAELPREKKALRVRTRIESFQSTVMSIYAICTPTHSSTCYVRSSEVRKRVGFVFVRLHLFGFRGKDRFWMRWRIRRWINVNGFIHYVSTCYCLRRFISTSKWQIGVSLAHLLGFSPTGRCRLWKHCCRNWEASRTDVAESVCRSAR